MSAPVAGGRPQISPVRPTAPLGAAPRRVGPPPVTPRPGLLLAARHGSRGRRSDALTRSARAGTGRRRQDRSAAAATARSYLSVTISGRGGRQDTARGVGARSEPAGCSGSSGARGQPPSIPDRPTAADRQLRPTDRALRDGMTPAGVTDAVTPRRKVSRNHEESRPVTSRARSRRAAESRGSCLLEVSARVRRSDRLACFAAG